MMGVHTCPDWVNAWVQAVQGQRPALLCVLGFTETALIPGISAAGLTPADRRQTAAADAEFLVRGRQPQPVYPLPPLIQGVSPVYLSRAVVEALHLPVTLVNTGLPVPLSVGAVTLGETWARCVSTGQAMAPGTVRELWQAGWAWGQSLLAARPAPYFIIGECVVGGTTTALAVLTGLGWAAQGRVSSSHPRCNHDQKWQVVQTGLARAGDLSQPWAVVAAVGDPMQVVVAAVTLAIHREVPVLLAGGTQMLAVWALIQAIARREHLPWWPERVVVGTTGWVVNDPTAQVVALAADLGAPLVSSALDFRGSAYPALRQYEQGFVKEGVAAGGCALAAHWYRGWDNSQVLAAVEALLNPAMPRPIAPEPDPPQFR
ncbi:MAG: TIGR00303 family protein [Gloeomargarita sp. DG_2_bins_126]